VAGAEAEAEDGRESEAEDGRESEAEDGRESEAEDGRESEAEGVPLTPSSAAEDSTSSMRSIRLPSKKASAMQNEQNKLGSRPGITSESGGHQSQKFQWPQPSQSFWLEHGVQRP